jgi:hypothetical protein
MRVIDRVDFVRLGRLTPDPQTILAGPGSIKLGGQQGVDPVVLQGEYLPKLALVQRIRLVPNLCIADRVTVDNDFNTAIIFPAARGRFGAERAAVAEAPNRDPDSIGTTPHASVGAGHRERQPPNPSRPSGTSDRPVAVNQVRTASMRVPETSA